VRAAGYDEELVKTAVLRFWFLLIISLFICVITLLLIIRACCWIWWGACWDCGTRFYFSSNISLHLCYYVFFLLIVKNCGHRWTVRAFSQRQTGREFCCLFALSICNDCVSGCVVVWSWLSEIVEIVSAKEIYSLAVVLAARHFYSAWIRRWWWSETLLSDDS
jgi:hypothetical protein